jgi:Mg-chelatase subunit ChlI
MEEKDRIAALQKAGVSGASIVGCDEFKSYLINLDIFPKYGNVIFVEGVPGAGKTRAVLITIVDMLK